MADFLEDKKREIEARLKELRPLVDEFHRLEAAVQALDGVNANGTSTPTAPTRRRPVEGHRPARPPARIGHALEGGTGPRAQEARDHDPRARRRDEDQAELP